MDQPDARFAGYYCSRVAEHPLHREHHDCEHGFSPRSDAGYLERLAWEIFQPGLSWRLILEKRPILAELFAGFDAEQVASFGAGERRALLNHPQMIKHQRKIDAVIHNAGIFVRLKKQHGGFEGWLQTFEPQNLAALSGIMQKQFKFVGPSVAFEFLLGAGIVSGAHHPACPIFPLIIEHNPWWAKQI